MTEEKFLTEELGRLSTCATITLSEKGWGSSSRKEVGRRLSKEEMLANRLSDPNRTSQSSRGEQRRRSTCLVE